ncbi:MAG: hypothetical protein IH848_03410 [Acidobacteria bacterium]|nr:hypothetical protein [Acidobacteriota bacterium]
MLFTGDADAPYEVELLNAFGEEHFHSDVLKVTHHGSANGTDESVLAEIRPGIAIASTAADDDHRLEHVIKNRLEGITTRGYWASDRWATIFETLVDGDITLRTDGIPSEPGETDVLYSVEYSAENRHVYPDGHQEPDPGLFALQRGLHIQLDGGRP